MLPWSYVGVTPELSVIPQLVSTPRTSIRDIVGDLPVEICYSIFRHFRGTANEELVTFQNPNRHVKGCLTGASSVEKSLLEAVRPIMSLRRVLRHVWLSLPSPEQRLPKMRFVTVDHFRQGPTAARH